jgi:membrane-associated phospholipid phosphatase
MQSTVRNLWGCLSGRNALYHIAAIVITYVFVVTKIDWNFLILSQEYGPAAMLFAADLLGYLFPVAITGYFVYRGWRHRSVAARVIAQALAQSVILGVFVAGVYKSIAGRPSPPHHGVLIDISNEFNFGFMQENILGGWPSSHAAVAFALAFCLVTLFPKKKLMHIAVILLAGFIGLGVALGFHWLSELIAGTLIGITIGVTVGRSHRAELVAAKNTQKK